MRYTDIVSSFWRRGPAATRHLLHEKQWSDSTLARFDTGGRGGRFKPGHPDESFEFSGHDPQR